MIEQLWCTLFTRNVAVSFFHPVQLRFSTQTTWSRQYHVLASECHGFGFQFICFLFYSVEYIFVYLVSTLHFLSLSFPALFQLATFYFCDMAERLKQKHVLFGTEIVVYCPYSALLTSVIFAHFVNRMNNITYITH